MRCAIIDEKTLVVVGVCMAEETDSTPQPGTFLKADPNGEAVIGLHWSPDTGFEKPIIDGPIPQ